jgi:SAM-dependent methyltransferase
MPPLHSADATLVATKLCSIDDICTTASRIAGIERPATPLRSAQNCAELRRKPPRPLALNARSPRSHDDRVQSMSATPIHPDNAAQSEYWNSEAGQRWRDHQDHQDQVLRPISERLIAAADAKAGDRVIDVGCGCGATTLDFAVRVAPGGEVLGLDLSEVMLARARERAPPESAARFVLADATTHEMAPEWADLIVSRFGVMFFADPARSFANLRRGLRPGGRLAFACWREARQNIWMIVPLREAAKHAPPLPEMGPEDPGPFAFADPARVRRILSEAGYADIVINPQDLDLDIAVGKGLDAAVAASLAIGPTSRILNAQSEAVRTAAEKDIRAALAARAVGQSVPLGAAIWIVTAKNPGGWQSASAGAPSRRTEL